MTNMPKISGTSRRTLRWRRKRAAPSFGSRKLDATPEIRNSRPRRQGDDSIMNGSMASLACGLFTCQSQVT